MQGRQTSRLFLGLCMGCVNTCACCFVFFYGNGQLGVARKGDSGKAQEKIKFVILTGP